MTFGNIAAIIAKWAPIRFYGKVHVDFHGIRVNSHGFPDGFRHRFLW